MQEMQIMGKENCTNPQLKPTKSWNRNKYVEKENGKRRQLKTICRNQNEISKAQTAATLRKKKNWNSRSDK